MTVHRLAANQPPRRFYRGGPAIAAFRGIAGVDDHQPEDWVGSVTAVAGTANVGMTTLPDGRLLADAIAADPIRWLGEAHVARWGTDPMMLAKLLDAGQRLPIHAHPDRAFAAEHLGHAHGKAEAWFILTGGEVSLGLREPLSPDEARELVATQAVDDLLARLHRVTVAPGDTVYVPPGTLHAIGEGVLLAEIQEPEDLSILLEWRDFDIDGAEHGHLGLGFDLALRAVTLDALPEADLRRLIAPRAAPALLPASADPYFRLERRAPGGADEVDGGFAVVVVLDGAGELERSGERMRVQRGETLALEHAGGPVRMGAELDVLLMRPPAAEA